MRNGSAVRHGVAGVDAKIQQNQFEFGGIDENGPKIFGEIGAHMDVASQRAVEQIAHTVKLGAKIDGLGLERLAASERQQLPAQRCAALGGLPHPFENPTAPRRISRPLDHRQAAQDDHEEVVEVVGDAAGQLADGFDFLGLTQLAFGFGQPGLIADAVGDVVDELERADNRAAAIAQRVELHLVGPTVPGGIAELLDEREFLAGQRPRPNGLHVGLVLRHDRTTGRACCRRPSAERQRCARIRWRWRG